ncbi:MAG: ARPP-1 family domain-containing protein, partial [Candidatus Acidiferrales bacterium]
MHRAILAILLVAASAIAPLAMTKIAPRDASRWQAHEPVLYSNLALFPVTTATGHNSSGYITLDEGLATGEVEVSELGALLRCRPHTRCAGQAQVNTLALVNRSKRTLILLAGEIVTGGKQDRVISKDRLVLPGAEPLPLDVFCVEPGRWSGASANFQGKSFMAAPSVREKAAVARNQQEVWDATGQMRSRVAAAAPAAEAELRGSSSYAQL